MNERARLILKEGRMVWIPCEVKGGMFPTERFISVAAQDVFFSGFVPAADVRESVHGQTGQVRAVIARANPDTVALVFRGEIFSSTNPVVVPSQWVTTTTTAAAG